MAFFLTNTLSLATGKDDQNYTWLDQAKMLVLTVLVGEL